MDQCSGTADISRLIFQTGLLVLAYSKEDRLWFFATDRGCASLFPVLPVERGVYASVWGRVWHGNGLANPLIAVASVYQTLVTAFNCIRIDHFGKIHEPTNDRQSGGRSAPWRRSRFITCRRCRLAPVGFDSPVLRYLLADSRLAALSRRSLIHSDSDKPARPAACW